MPAELQAELPAEKAPWPDGLFWLPVGRRQIANTHALPSGRLGPSAKNLNNHTT